MNKDYSQMVIAIDGHSSTGKSTIAKMLASDLGLAYIDTGAMYRMVTLAAMRAGIIDESGDVNLSEIESLISTLELTFRYNPTLERAEAYLNNENVEEQIRRLDVSSNVSKIAAIAIVRHFLVAQQRQMGQKGGVVMDGRDIGSVVFPDADVKFFMTASVAVRAQRRYDELCAKGEQVSYEEVEHNVIERDHIDETRKESPLVRVEDAHLIDNSAMTIEQELNIMKDIILQSCKG